MRMFTSTPRFVRLYGAQHYSRSGFCLKYELTSKKTQKQTNSLLFPPFSFFSFSFSLFCCLLLVRGEFCPHPAPHRYASAADILKLIRHRDRLKQKAKNSKTENNWDSLTIKQLVYNHHFIAHKITIKEYRNT